MRKKFKTPFDKKPKGFVSIYMVFSMMLLIPIVGLAIDFSVLYNVKGKLQAACDAAAIGSGIMLQRSTDMTDPAQVANIQDAAQRFFNANYRAGYFGSTQAYYESVPSEDRATKVRTIYVHAAQYVPMLFLRVLHINNSTVAAQATVKVRFVTMMVVVDRSGSVQRAHNDTAIKNALNQFVSRLPSSTPPGQSIFVDGRDEIGLVSFGSTWNMDYAPSVNFRSSAPNFETAVSNIPFGNNSTNTAEGLYQAYAKLQALNETGALNVIVLLTDGRPSALTVQVNAQGSCATKGLKTGVVAANVGQSWPPIPPTVWGGLQDLLSTIWTFGLFEPHYTGLFSGADSTFVAGSAGCHYANDLLQPILGANLYLDAPTLPLMDAHGNSTTGPVATGAGLNIGSPQAIRYAAMNAADNMATRIRQDTTVRPILFVIGLNEPPSAGEPLDADWLARVANDPGYKNSLGNPVYQAGQTPGMYFNVDSSGLSAAFQQIASQILRLAQ